MAKKTSSAATPAEREFHLVCSSGGSRAILASAGVLLACDLAGIKKFKSIGGVSGGSIPTALYASGLDARACAKQALEIDFTSLLTKRANMFNLIVAYFMQRRNEKVRPIDGVMTSEKLGDFIESFASTSTRGWPKGYWTMGIADKSEIIFNEAGVFEIEDDGILRALESSPGSLGTAVRGSCAVPGVISAVEYGERFLFDGALGTEGRCPVSVPARLFGAKRSNIIACDVGDDVSKTSERVAALWRHICGPECVPDMAEPDFVTEGKVIVVKPKITGFRSLQFKLTPDQKWGAIMAAFVEAVSELAHADVLTGDALTRAEEIVGSYQRIQKESDKAGQLSERTIALLTENELF